MHIKDMAELLSKEDLQGLKSQCGGLQTLIRNHKHVFLVEKGLLSLNMPSAKQPQGHPSKRTGRTELPKRRRECWFFVNHPQGCPLQDDQCAFDHKQEDPSAVQSALIAK